MKLTYYILFLASLLLTACNDEEEEKEFVMTAPPIGETYESSTSIITFESADSVSFHVITIDKKIKHRVGKAKYLFNNGKVEILNSHELHFPIEETKEPFFLFFHGSFTSKDRLDAKFAIIAERAYFQAMGESTWYHTDSAINHRP